MSKRIKRKFRYLIGLLILVGLIGGFLYFQFSKSEPVQAAWYDDNWLYRQKTEITNSGSIQTDFQVLITLDTATVITANKMQSDCDDIRITDINGKLLSHWLETGTNACNTSTTAIWTKVPSIPTSGQTVYIYYGNPSANSVQNGNNVFDFFDDFSESILNTSKWPTTSGTMTLSNGIATVGQESYIAATNFDFRNYSAASMEGRVKVNSAPTKANFGAVSSNYFGMGEMGASARGFNHLWFINTTTYQETADETSGSENYWFTFTTNWNRISLKWISGASVTFMSEGNSATKSDYIPTTSASAAINPHINVREYSAGMDLDFVFVRKYSASVSIGSPSSEERGPGPVAFWKFDEGYGQTANDTTLNNNDGTLGSTSGSDTNDPFWQTEDMCLSGKCLKFDGTDDYVNAGNATSLHLTNNISVLAWIKWNGQTNDPGIVSTMPTWDSPSRGWVFRLWDNPYRLGVLIGQSAATPISLEGDQDDTLASGNWKQVGFVFSRPNLYLITNGAIVKTFTYDADLIFSAPDPVHIGNFYTSWIPTQNFNGTIDEVRIYPYARTAAQIKADYASRGMAKGASAVIASEAKQSLSNGLVAYYKMDESSWTNDCSTATVTDSSGAGNNGKSCPASTGPNTTSTAKFARAGSFDGSDDYVDAGTSTSLNITDAITISAWVKPVSYPHDQNDIVGRKNDAGIFGITDGGYLFYGWRNSDGSVYSEIYSSLNVPTGQFSHVVVVHQASPSILRFYVNGNEKEYLNSGADSIRINSDALMVGVQYGPSWNRYFNGTIDEVRIYNRALSPKEVRDLYNWAPGPVAYWNMDEKTGTTINDQSSNNNTGTLSLGSGGNTTVANAWTQGKYGAGLSFDGTDDYVDAGNAASLRPENLTVEFWLYPKGWTDLNTGYSSHHVYYMGDGYGIITGDSNWGWWIYTASGRQYRSLSHQNQLNTWHHVVLTYDKNSGNMKFYWNGVLKDTYNLGAGTPINYTGTWLAIGHGGDYVSNGSIDDVRIYNYARTQKQIVEDMLARQSLSGGGNADCDNTVLCTKFDEGYGGTAQDSSPQNNDGTLYPGTGGTNTTTAQMWSNSAKFGKAMEFDGTDDYVSVADSASLNITGAITIEAWVKLVAPFPTRGRVVEKSPGATGYFLAVLSNRKMQFGIGDGSTWKQPEGSTVLDFDKFYHLAGVYDGTNIYMYVNGQRDATPTASNPPASIAYNPRIGSYSGFEDFFNGLIDEVKIYNYALTEDEIKLEYNRGAAVHLGSVSTGSDGTTPSYSSDRSYCIPGDTSTCNPPVAEWNLNEKTGQSANDSSGSGNTGTLGASSGVDSSDPTWVSAKIGAGLQFDGSNDYVSVADSASLNITNAITIEAWVKPAMSYTPVAEKYGSIVVQGSEAYLYFHKTAGVYLALYNPDGFWMDIGRNTTINANTWYHVVGTFNGSISRLFLNGVQLGADQANAGTIKSRTGATVISRQINGDYFNGSIDDVRIYNYARTPAQIAWDYNRGKPVAHWKFDECQGATAYDASGNANHGTTTIGASGTQTGIGTCTDGNTANARYNGRNGKYNSALNFDGTDDYVDAGDGATLNITNAITLKAWVKRGGDGAGAFPAIVGITRNYGPANGGVLITYYPSGDKIRAYLRPVGQDWVFAESNADLPLGIWTHIIATDNGTTLKLFVDGVEQNTKGSHTGVIYRDGDERGLVGNYGGANFFNGSIDEVKVFNYALTPAQIKTEYNEGAAIRFGPTTGSP